MRKLFGYVSLIALVLILFQAAITIVPTKDEIVAHRLAESPESWEVSIVDSSILWEDETEKEIKERMIGFIELAGTPTYTDEDFPNGFLYGVFLISAVGYVGEVIRDRKKRRTSR